MTSEKEFGSVEINETSLQSKIYFVRNQKVMLDFELAEIYGCETKNFNRQVKNNNDKFDQDFMFQLSKEEYKENLTRSKIFTSRNWTMGNNNICVVVRTQLTKITLKTLKR